MDCCTDSGPIKVFLSPLPLDVNEAVAFVSNHKSGAVSMFIGTTRDTEKSSSSDETKSITGLFYEVYEDMAVKQMTEIADRIMVQRNLVKCYLAHRTGHVPVGHPSILIATSSPHRHESHSAVMDILNEVKSKVPVWKKVIYSIGNPESAVRNGDHCHWSDKSEAFWLNK